MYGAEKGAICTGDGRHAGSDRVRNWYQGHKAERVYSDMEGKLGVPSTRGTRHFRREREADKDVRVRRV